MLYAVKNRNTGKYVTGTDFRSGKPRQIMDANRAPLLLDDYGGTLPEGATLEMKRRGINLRRYKVVPVEVQEIEKRRQQTEPERKPLPAGYYNLDCMAALPLFPDKFFDIAVIDAPYGIGADNMAMGTNKARKKNGYPAESTAERVKRGRKESGAGKWDNQVPPPEYFTELFRVSKHCIIWGGNYYDLPPTRGVIVWDKLQPWEAFSQVEIAWTDYDRSAAIVKLSNTGGANTEKKIHTTQKPPELYGWLFSHYLQLKRGARFLDTHVGSASSLMAAHDAGLQAWGFEKDAYYYGLSADRLERHKAQYNIFQVAEQMEIEL